MKKLLGCLLVLGSYVVVTASPALAEPALQLDIVGGTYVGGTEQSVITSATEFDVLAMD